MTYFHGRSDSASRSEFGDDRHPPRSRGCDQIIQDVIRHPFIERAVIAELLQVQLQRLQLIAQPVGNVGDRQRAEIRLARLGANGCELGADCFDLIAPVGTWVLKSFEN